MTAPSSIALSRRKRMPHGSKEWVRMLQRDLAYCKAAFRPRVSAIGSSALDFLCASSIWMDSVEQRLSKYAVVDLLYSSQAYFARFWRPNRSNEDINLGVEGLYLVADSPWFAEPQWGLKPLHPTSRAWRICNWTDLNIANPPRTIRKSRRSDEIARYSPPHIIKAAGRGESKSTNI
jgi:hypothetical protein